MLICKKCGKIIYESDLGKHSSFLSYYGDKPIYETVYDNCSCGGDYEEYEEDEEDYGQEECDFCGELSPISEISFGWRYDVKYCKKCMSYYKSKYKCLSEEFLEDDEFIDCLCDKNLIKR